jgi:hypothetical protein
MLKEKEFYEQDKNDSVKQHEDERQVPRRKTAVE